MLCLCMDNKHVVQCIVESSVCSGVWCVHCMMAYAVEYGVWCMYVVKHVCCDVCRYLYFRLQCMSY